MSHVEFKKLQCRMALSLKLPFVPCRIEGKALSHVAHFFAPIDVNVVKVHVELLRKLIGMSPHQF